MGEKYFLRVHEANGYRIVAICDEEILGMVFKEGEFILDVSPRFYQGDKVEFEKALEVIKNADIAVITGRRIVEKLSELGFVDKEFVLNIGGQLHIQIVREVYRY